MLTKVNKYWQILTNAIANVHKYEKILEMLSQVNTQYQLLTNVNKHQEILKNMSKISTNVWMSDDIKYWKCEQMLPNDYKWE